MVYLMERRNKRCFLDLHAMDGLSFYVRIEPVLDKPGYDCRMKTSYRLHTIPLVMCTG